jgi:hypothetical protein
MLARMQMPQFKPMVMMPPPQARLMPWTPPPQQKQSNPMGGMMGLMPLMGLFGQNQAQANAAGNSPAPWGGNADTFDPGYGYSVAPSGGGLFGLFG